MVDTVSCQCIQCPGVQRLAEAANALITLPEKRQDGGGLPGTEAFRRRFCDGLNGLELGAESLALGGTFPDNVRETDQRQVHAIEQAVRGATAFHVQASKAIQTLPMAWQSGRQLGSMEI